MTPQGMAVLAILWVISHMDPLVPPQRHRFVESVKQSLCQPLLLAASDCGRNTRFYLASYGNPTAQRAVHYTRGLMGGIKVRA
jgi:hypothetical protein